MANWCFKAIAFIAFLVLAALFGLQTWSRAADQLPLSALTFEELRR